MPTMPEQGGDEAEGTDPPPTADTPTPGDGPPAGRARPDLHTLLSSSRVQYGTAFIAASVVVALVFRPWTYGHDYIFSTGTDWLWQQGTFQMHADGGPWGATDHLAWPVGANAWRYPQIGMLVATFAWVTVGLLGMGTAAATLWCLVFAAGLNAVGMVFMLRQFGGGRFGALTVAVAVSLSSCVFVVTHQINLSLFCALPFVFGAAAKALRADHWRSPWTLGLVVLMGFATPMWWVVVLFLAVPFFVVPYAVRRRWRDTVRVGSVWVALCVGFAMQTLVFLLAKRGGPGDDVSRGAWESNMWTGHFVDLFTGSPLVRRVLPDLTGRLRPGASLDLYYGVPLLLGAGIVVVVLLALAPRRTRAGHDTTLLASMSITFVLYWLGGGLSNLQAGLAVALGGVSPARIWYRMIVPLAIVGAAWIAASLEGRDGSRRVRRSSGIAAALLMLLSIADLMAMDARALSYTVASAPQPDLPAIRFLQAHTDPCPVAQFPDEAIPNGVIEADSIISPNVYRGMIPYVIAPEYHWTAGSFSRARPDALAQLPGDITDADLGALHGMGFCAVLYDRVAGAPADAQQSPLSGRTVTFSQDPDYQDDRYQLYLLPAP